MVGETVAPLDRIEPCVLLVEVLLVLGEPLLGLVGALYQQRQGAVGAGEPDFDRAADAFQFDGDGGRVGRGWGGAQGAALVSSSTMPRPNRSSSRSTGGRAMTRANPPATDTTH